VPRKDRPTYPIIAHVACPACGSPNAVRKKPDGSGHRYCMTKQDDGTQCRSRQFYTPIEIGIIEGSNTDGTAQKDDTTDDTGNTDGESVFDDIWR
jgi:hypothetical protein